MTIAPLHKILGLYAVLAFGVLMSCLPYMTAQNVGAVAVLLALIFSYVLESKSDKDSLETHHAIFIIRTIWIWTTFLLIGLCGAGYVVSQQGNMAAIDQLMGMINSGGIPTEADIQAASEAYLNDNTDLILKTALVWLAPAQIYAVWRLARGLSRAVKGYRINNFRSWF